MVVTCSPYVLKTNKLQFEPKLPKDKLEALECLEIHKALKIFMKFKKVCWPKDLQVS